MSWYDAEWTDFREESVMVRDLLRNFDTICAIVPVDQAPLPQSLIAEVRLGAVERLTEEESNVLHCIHVRVHEC